MAVVKKLYIIYLKKMKIENGKVNLQKLTQIL